MVNANAPVTPVLPAPATDATNTASGTTGVSSPGFKARTGSRSSPKTGSRLQNASKPSAAGAVAAADGTVTAKQNQSREQSEKKNQAINQLRKLLVQGNKRVEALATVIQHLFTEVLETFLCLLKSDTNCFHPLCTVCSSSAAVGHILYF